MLIAEDILLLATDDITGKITVSSMQLDPALAGAVLIELVVAGRVGLEGQGRSSKVVVTPGDSLDHPLLDTALRRLAEKSPLTPVKAISRLTKDLRDSLNTSLEQGGLLRRESGKVLGLFTTTRWPAEETGYEDAIRKYLAAALLGTQEPDARAAAIISVLTAADLLRTVVEKADLKVAKVRGKEIGDGNWASDSVRSVIQQAQAAIGVAVMVSTTAVVVGGSS